MKRLWVLLALAAVILPSLPAADPVPAEVKRSPLLSLPSYAGYKADPYLDAAIKLQAMGKEKAIAALTDLAAAEMRSGGTRTILLCRMLFKAKEHPKATIAALTPDFRPPLHGLPAFASDITAKDRQAECRDWPREPIDLVDGVPFLVVKGYLISGFPEPSSKYLDYCVRDCEWSDGVFKPKTAEEKRKALVKLVASHRWKRPLSDEAKKVLTSQIE
jgi:hypothetical protein